MTTMDHHQLMTRLVQTLTEIVARWPQVTATQLLECAKALPAIMCEAPFLAMLNARAVQLYIDDLVDGGQLPPWV